MTPPDPTLYDFSVTTIAGETQAMSAYRGRVLLIVNVASQCGFTPQYAALEALYRKRREAGLVVLGFPCNQFGGQEPGTNEAIADFCHEQYDVTFPLFAKVDVNGVDAHPLFTYLKEARPGLLGTKTIKWNFTKFLVSATGDVVARFGSSTIPEAIEPDIVRLLNQRAAPA